MASIAGLDAVPSPALLFDADAIERNLARMLDIVGGDPTRLRPHIKTHKCREILDLQRSLGIEQVKCATIAEAELAAIASVPDVLVSYPLVGPNIGRLLQLIERYPDTRFSALVDDPATVGTFGEAATAPLDLFVDLDCGMHRTGAAPALAVSLAKAIADHPRLRLAGLHAYDGHIHDASIEDRTARFEAALAIIDQVVAEIEAEAAPVPLVVSGGSPTFRLHAARACAASRPWQCSPGTTVLWDCGYGSLYPEDLPFEPAAFLLTRVVSHPGADASSKGRVCLDLGHKAVAAENPIQRRVEFPSIPDAEFLSQSEEHLVVGVPDLDACPVGTALIGIPKHVCPTVALHQEARIVRDGAVTGTAWKIAARDRRIHV